MKMDERTKNNKEGSSYKGMVFLTEEQSMINSIQQSQSTITNNITKMSQMMKQVTTES